MESNSIDRNLVAVLFPAVVKNDDKAIQCLGGIRGISQVYSQPTKKRLGLSFQPDNPFVKKFYGDINKTAGVLLKVKVKKKKVDNEIKREVVSTVVVGRVEKIYKFESMCDFQYLPVQREGVNTGSFKCIIEQILPSGVDQASFMSQPAPLYLFPSNFTRTDKPSCYVYTDKRYPERKDTPAVDEDIHMKSRSLRSIPLSQFTFNLVDDIPTEPHEYYFKRKDKKIDVYPNINNDYEILKKLFDERPVWSRNLLRYQTKIRLSVMKIILPCLSIYMRNGPWRSLWVRYGYDPRKEPGARIYQSLDFRLRHQAGVHCMVMTRNQIVHHKKADRVNSPKTKALGGPVSVEDISEGAVCFRPGMVPSQRQVFYQYCDVKLPEVEEILAAEPPPGFLCHQQRGWLAPNTDRICRDHIFRYVKETLLASHSADLKLEQGSSDDGTHSEDDCSSDEASNCNTSV